MYWWYKLYTRYLVLNVLHFFPSWHFIKFHNISIKKHYAHHILLYLYSREYNFEFHTICSMVINPWMLLRALWEWCIIEHNYTNILRFFCCIPQIFPKWYVPRKSWWKWTKSHEEFTNCQSLNTIIVPIYNQNIVGSFAFWTNWIW